MVKHEKIFWSCAAIYLLAWTIVSTLAIPNVPIDVLEGYAWGHEWPLGTYKHPPLTAWILEALAVITNRASWAHFLANQIAVAVTFWAVWQTGRRIVGETGALVSVLLLASAPYYNFLVPEFNPNVLQLPLWALICRSFYKAIKDDRPADWILLGLWSAAAMYTKYSSALLLASLSGLMVFHPESRKHLKTKGPWLTVLTAVLLLAPHIGWLFKNDFMPFTYAKDRLEYTSYGAAAFLAVPVLFIFWQAVALLPTIILYLVSFGGRLPRKPASFDEIFVCAITFGPPLLTCLIAAATKGQIRSMWATPFWNFIGIWAVLFLHPVFTQKSLRRFMYAGAFILIAGLTGFYGAEILNPYVTHKSKKIEFPGRSFAGQISQIWHQHYHTPLQYVVGNNWTGGNIAYYAPDRPHQLTDGNIKISPWINLDSLRKYGGVVVWCQDYCSVKDKLVTPDYLHTEFPQAEIQPPLVLPQQTGAPVSAAMLGWAILPPQKK